MDVNSNPNLTASYSKGIKVVPSLSTEDMSLSDMQDLIVNFPQLPEKSVITNSYGNNSSDIYTENLNHCATMTKPVQTIVKDEFLPKVSKATLEEAPGHIAEDFHEVPNMQKTSILESHLYCCTHDSGNDYDENVGVSPADDKKGTEIGDETDYKLTEDMVNEEEKIHEDTAREEEEYNKKRDEVMKEMSEETREQRYKRLQFLLTKCNSYTAYLVVRMSENRELQRDREERRARQLDKQARKKDERCPPPDGCLDRQMNDSDSASQPASQQQDSHEERDEEIMLSLRAAPVVTSSDKEAENAATNSGNWADSFTNGTVGEKKKVGRPKRIGGAQKTGNCERRSSCRRAQKNSKDDLGSQESLNILQESAKENTASLTPDGRGGNVESSPSANGRSALSPRNRSSDCDLDGVVTPAGSRGRKRKIQNASPSAYNTTDDRRKRVRMDNSQELCASQSGNQSLDGEVAAAGMVKLVSSPQSQKSAESADHNNNNNGGTRHEADDADMRMYNGELVPVGQPILFENGVLRQYQIEGFLWLNTMFENGVNGILADEMGLGKTVQVIATISHLIKQQVMGSYLIIAPLSTLPNWMSEFKRFCPKLPVFLYHGASRVNMRSRLGDWHTIPGHPEVKTKAIVVTSYEMAMNDSKYLVRYPWKYMVIDEGHRIKNFKCRLVKELKKFNIANRTLLTGTPLQNNMAELWSLLNFLLPEIFNDLESFEAWFDMDALSCVDSTERIIAQEQRTNILSMLHQILTPFILRRLKQDVDLVIPPKREILVYAPLTKAQHFYYAKTINRTMEAFVKEKKGLDQEVNEDLTVSGRPKRTSAKRKVNYKAMMESDKDKGYKTKKRFSDGEDEELDQWIKDMDENQKTITWSSNKEKTPVSSNLTVNLRNTVMLLRKCVNHPYLLEYPLQDDGQYKIDGDLVDASGKLLVLDKMLPELKKRGHKVLIFSQMTSVLDILEDYCYLREYKYSRLDGSMNLFKRQEEMDNFRTDREMFLFLLSTKAGGLGLNLTSADTVIIYDSDWNPQGDLQAQDRCHRIGQTTPVMVYRLVTAGTIDQKMIERAATKRKLEKMIMHKEKFKNTEDNWISRAHTLNPDELLSLLESHEPDSVFDSHRQSVMSNRVLTQLLDRTELYEKWMAVMDAGENKAKKLVQPVRSVALDAGVAGSYQIVGETDEFTISTV